MSDLANLGAEAKIKYLDGDFIIEVPGTHVFCSITGKPILMEMLRYWNVDFQEQKPLVELRNKGESFRPYLHNEKQFDSKVLPS